MRLTFDEYLADVRSQLECNASDEYKGKHIVYPYTVAVVDENIDYFKDCHKGGMSAYKALLFFHDYLAANDELRLLFRAQVVALANNDNWLKNVE